MDNCSAVHEWLERPLSDDVIQQPRKLVPHQEGGGVAKHLEQQQYGSESALVHGAE
eukprot:CAMPEP_0184395348 /NCGR_PEP_ID=MMETSP0007-20130409/43872_1 /TAXON_ID=97485 /ORGANISM="Prymnesium parvum, Strain Texoma1" /LENGTH=55 /DNA_ID=CAMNT_0026747469 /DNA_START=225 /DNA_END=392 /DNA_ORIENTATION=+